MPFRMGGLYNCDFNGMLDLKVARKVKYMKDYNDDIQKDRNNIISKHCYGYKTATGNSAQGALARNWNYVTYFISKKLKPELWA